MQWPLEGGRFLEAGDIDNPEVFGGGFEAPKKTVLQ